jgi:hypothetical protein
MTYFPVITFIVHVSYYILFAGIHCYMDELTRSFQSLHDTVWEQVKSEEDNAKDEIRIKTMQDKIDELVEHQRIFDILLTRYEARIIQLERSPAPPAPEEDDDDDSLPPLIPMTPPNEEYDYNPQYGVEELKAYLQ